MEVGDGWSSCNTDLTRSDAGEQRLEAEGRNRISHAFHLYAIKQKTAQVFSLFFLTILRG